MKTPTDRPHRRTRALWGRIGFGRMALGFPSIRSPSPSGPGSQPPLPGGRRAGPALIGRAGRGVARPPGPALHGRPPPSRAEPARATPGRAEPGRDRAAWTPYDFTVIRRTCFISSSVLRTCWRRQSTPPSAAPRRAGTSTHVSCPARLALLQRGLQGNPLPLLVHHRRPQRGQPPLVLLELPVDVPDLLPPPADLRLGLPPPPLRCRQPLVGGPQHHVADLRPRQLPHGLQEVRQAPQRRRPLRPQHQPVHPAARGRHRLPRGVPPAPRHASQPRVLEGRGGREEGEGEEGGSGSAPGLRPAVPPRRGRPPAAGPPDHAVAVGRLHLEECEEWHFSSVHFLAIAKGDDGAAAGGRARAQVERITITMRSPAGPPLLSSLAGAVVAFRAEPVARRLRPAPGFARPPPGHGRLTFLIPSMALSGNAPVSGRGAPPL